MVVGGVFTAVALRAQTGTSSITGTITDQSGGVLGGVSLEITNEETGAKIKTKSNDAGSYRVASLAPGIYTIQTDLAGFNQTVRKSLVLTVTQVLAVDLVLQVSGSAQTVEVESSVPLVDSQSSSSGQLVSRQMVADLPMPNRAASALVSLAPGAVMIDTGTGAENYPLFSVAGGRARNQNFTLDGGNVTNAVGLTRPMQMTSLPIDAMQEFRVISNNYSAEQGHSTGGVITLATRSGTNQYHGSIFEYLRNNALDARNFFAAEKPPLRRNQFGGTFGGPIRKDKTHFFLSWEQTRETSSLPVISTVPTEKQRQGNFSGLVDASGRPVVIYDPATTVGKTRQTFDGNVIPQDRIDPVARAVLNYWPHPNRAADATGANDYISNSDSYLQRNIIVGKLDHQLRPSDLLSARYYINDSYTENQGSFGIPVADSRANQTDVRVQSILVGHTHIFRPNLINELKVSFLQRKFIDTRYGYDANLAEAIGLTGVSGAAFPAFTIPGYSSLGGEPGRIQTPIRDTQILESVSWYRGKHAFKLGVEYRRGANNEIRDRSSSGSFTFTPLITGVPGTSNTGNALASFLLGEVNAAAIQVSDLIPSRASYWAGYLQDDWRVTERLTLNFGLRWETEIPRSVEGNSMNSFDLQAINPVSGTPGVVTFAGQNGVSKHAFNTDLNNWGPRFGFAYRTPFLKNTVIRGGAGAFYGSTVSNTIGDTASTGFSTSANFVAPQTDTTSAMQLRNGFPAFERPPLDAGFGAVPLGKKPFTSVGFFERDRPTPISYQYNFNIQHELAKDLVIEAGYLGNVSHHLTANDLSLNQVPPGLMGSGDAQARRPFPQFSNVYIINPAVGNSTYHAGYIKAEKRFSRGLSFLAHYTYSKFIDDVESSVEYGDTGSYMDAYNRRLDKALSGSDVPHRTILSVLYEVPTWKRNRFANALLGRWNIGILTTLQSGAPFTVITTANSTNAFPAGPLRPNLTGNPLSGERTLQHWFNTAAFTAPQPFQFGNSPRSVLRGDSLQTVDLTLSKAFALTERFHADIRGEFYNLLNHANFNIPGHTLGAADFGLVSSARAGRAVQLGMRVSF